MLTISLAGCADRAPSDLPAAPLPTVDARTMPCPALVEPTVEDRTAIADAAPTLPAAVVRFLTAAVTLRDEIRAACRTGL